MPFDAVGAGPRPTASRIAVVGAGISGLSAAWLLSKTRATTIYEQSALLGGHANTIDIPLPSAKGAATVPVDAGFIVYNEPAYPNLTALFEHLGVASQPACMSFGASMRGGALEYSGQTLSSVFADRRNLFSPKFWRMLSDITRFHREARRALADGLPAAVTLGEFVAQNRLGAEFARDFLTPMASAIWSTPSRKILDCSASAFIRFYGNHGLLQVLDLPTWRTVAGGSCKYVEKLGRDFSGAVRLNRPVVSVRRTPRGVEIRDAKGGVDIFDEVVIAAHADQALAMLADATAEERRLLGAFRYQKNRAVVHFDEEQMPKRRRVWSSWNYLGDDERAQVSYWMNRLQSLDCDENIFVTLNPLRAVREETIVAEFDYAHPMFDVAAAAAQRELWSLQGGDGIWFCGAHFGQGFHEDGLQAGLAVAEAIGGARRPWTVENESGRIHLAPAQHHMALAA